MQLKQALLRVSMTGPCTVLVTVKQAQGRRSPDPHLEVAAALAVAHV